MSDQEVRKVRERASQLAENSGAHDFEITVEDVRFLIVCRAIGFGSMEQLSIVGGKPSTALRVTERFDFKRDLKVSD